jgi:aspartate aminotransferase
VLKLIQKELLLHNELPIDNADHFAQWLLESYDFNGEQLWSRRQQVLPIPGVGLNQVRIAYEERT